MAWPSINVNTPAGNSAKRLGDDAIREFKGQVIQALQEISGYPNSSATRTTVWTTEQRPSSDLVDGLCGFNVTLGCDEYWDETNSEWVQKTIDSTSAIQSLVDAVVPVGSIMMWGGSVANIPSRWKLCDGQNSTPDLRGKFVLGAGGSYSVGAFGGEETHTLTINEMPSHTHMLSDYLQWAGTNGPAWDGTRGITTKETSAVGGNGAHNNMPPYYALCYIMRVS